MSHDYIQLRPRWTTLDKADRLEWGDDGFVLDLQSKGKYNSNTDTCSEPLFSYVNKRHPFWKHGVTTSFVALLDNYVRETGRAESVTAEEKREMAAFLDALCATPVVRFAFEFLKVHGKDPRW